MHRGLETVNNGTGLCMQYNHIVSQNEVSFMSAIWVQRCFFFFRIFHTWVKCFFFFSRHNHLSHNGVLILLFILTRHWGHHSRSGCLISNHYAWAGATALAGDGGCCVQARAKPPLGLGCHVCSCKSHQIRSHSAGDQPVESHGSTAGLTPLRAVQIWTQYGRMSLQQMCCDFTEFPHSQIISSLTDTTVLAKMKQHCFSLVRVKRRLKGTLHSKSIIHQFFTHHYVNKGFGQLL